MRRSVLLLATVLLMALTIMLATRHRGVHAPATTSRATLADRQDASSAATPAPAIEPEREAAEQPHPVTPTPVTGSLTIVVLHAATGRPVANSHVAVVSTGALSRAMAEAGTAMHAPTGRRIYRALAHRATANALGEATLAVPDAPLLLEARSGDLWGFATLPAIPDDARTTVAIGPDRELRVRVRDALGQPRADVPIALRRQTTGPPRPAYSYQQTVTERPDGIATFLHFQRRLRQGDGWHAMFAFPVRGEPAVAVDERTAPEPPQQLQLPPTGGLRITIHDSDGNTVTGKTFAVHVTALADGTSLWPDGPWTRPRLDPESGTAHVPWLGLGLELRVEIRRKQQTIAIRELAGPMVAGEIVACAVQLDPQLHWHRVARGRFVNNDGSPWPACTVGAYAMLLPTPADGPEWQEILVDDEGRFTLRVEHAVPGNGSRRYLVRAQHPDGTGRVTTYIPINEAIPRAGIDLGDVQLDHGPMLIAGTVLGPGHQPVAGARLQLYAHTVALGDEMWPHVTTSGTTQTSEDGRFQLFLPRGTIDPGTRLRVSAHCESFVPAQPAEVARGDQHVVIVMARASSIAGSLVLADGMIPADLRVDLKSETPPRAAGTRSPVHALTVQPDGSFEQAGLPDGIYTLRVRRRGADNRPEPEPVIAIAGLQVIPGQVCRDPRIQRLPVDALCSTVSITVVDRRSTPLANAIVTIIGLPNARSTRASANGVCRVRTRTLPINLEITAFGHRAQQLQGIVADRQVVLDDGIAVRLRCGAQPNGQNPHYRLGIHLYDVDSDGHARRMTYGASYPWQARYFDTNGQLALRLPGPGIYEGSVFVYVSGIDRVGRGAPVRMPSRPRITVLEGATVQVFDLNIPQVAVDAGVVRGSR